MIDRHSLIDKWLDEYMNDWLKYNEKLNRKTGRLIDR